MSADPISSVASCVESIVTQAGNLQAAMNTGDMRARRVALGIIQFQSMLGAALSAYEVDPTPQNLEAIQQLEGI